MEMSGIVPAVLAGMSSAAVLLLGMWRMLAHHEKRNEKAHNDLRDAITSTATRLESRLEKRNEKTHDDLRDAITSTATRLESRLEKRFDRIETRLDQMDERLRNVEQGFA